MSSFKSLFLYESMRIFKVYSYQFCRICSHVTFKSKKLLQKNTIHKNESSQSYHFGRKIKFKSCDKFSVDFVQETERNEIQPKKVQTINKFNSYESCCYEIDDYDAITNGNPEKLKTVKLLQLEIDLMAQKGEKVPRRLKTDHWQELLYYSNNEARINFLRFLWFREIKNLNAKIKRFSEIRTHFHKTENNYEWKTSGPLIYSLKYNTIFLQRNTNIIHRYLNFKLFQAMMFGAPLIIDLDFEDETNMVEVFKTSKQLLLLFNENRNSFNPFHLIFCNVKSKNKILKKLVVTIPELYDIDFPFFYTDNSYLDLFPKTKLIYISEQSPNEMPDYQHDRAYILASLGFRETSEVFAKANKEGLLTIRLPFDEYIMKKIDKKSVPLNHTVQILNDIMNGQYWHYAFERVLKKLNPQDCSKLYDTKLENASIQNTKHVYSLLWKNLVKNVTESKKSL